MTTRPVLLTRFNLPTPGREGVIRAREGWLRDRVALFERFTVPSVRAQVLTPDWLVYLDPESPSWLLALMDGHRDEGLLRPVLRAEVGVTGLREDLRALGVGPGERLVTMNLDNDDGLAVDFVRRVVHADPGGPSPTAIYLQVGLVRRGAEAYRLVDAHNAFCAVAEPGDGPVTCWSDWHTLLPTVMPVVGVRGEPGWLQVVHGRNVSNRVRGRRVDPAPYDDLFRGLLAGVAPVSRAVLARERWLRAPARAARETVRAGAKRLALGVLGKRRFDAAKSVATLALARVARTARMARAQPRRTR